jgi:molybdopterin converting factor small subunit
VSAAPVAVRLPAGLRAWSGGRAVVHIDVGGGASTVAALLDQLGVELPDVERRVRDEQGHLRAHVNVFVGSDNIRDLDGLATRVAGGAQVTILPAVSGGR